MNDISVTSRAHTSHRLSATLRLMSHLARLGDERELIDTVVQAAAIWYDVDARGYQRNLRGRFVLDTSLPGANVTLGPRDFSSFALVPGAEVTRISSVEESERLGWHKLDGDLVLLPIGGGPDIQPRWVVAIRDWPDPDIDTSLLVLCRMLGAAVEQLTVARARDLQQRMLRWFVQGAESSEQQARVVLEELASSLPAEHARLMLRFQRETEPRIVALVGGDWPHKAGLPSFESTQPVLTPEQIVVPLPIGPDAVGAVELRPRAGEEFTVTHGILGQAAATMLGVWLAGVLARRQQAAGHEGEGLERVRFEARIDEEVERAKRFGLELGLVVADVRQERTRLSTLLSTDKLAGQLRTSDLAGRLEGGQLRTSDLAGRLEGGQLAVLLPHTGPVGITSAAQRLRERFEELGRSSGLPPVALSKVTFPADGSSGSALVHAATTGVTSQSGKDPEATPPVSASQ